MTEELKALNAVAEEAKTALAEVRTEIAAERLKVKKAAEDRYVANVSKHQSDLGV